MMEYDDMVERKEEERRIKRLFEKQKLEEKIDAEADLSIIDSSEDQIEYLDNADLYHSVSLRFSFVIEFKFNQINQSGPGEKMFKKYPQMVKGKKIGIRQHPEIKRYRMKDIEYEKIKGMKLNDDEKLECKLFKKILLTFIETNNKT